MKELNAKGTARRIMNAKLYPDLSDDDKAFIADMFKRMKTNRTNEQRLREIAERVGREVCIRGDALKAMGIKPSDGKFKRVRRPAIAKKNG